MVVKKHAYTSQFRYCQIGVLIFKEMEKEGFRMSEEEEFSKLIAISKCPLCDGELTKGYIGSIEDIVWGLNKQKFFAMGRGDWRFALNIPALKCNQCNIIIFDYGYDWRTPRSFLKKCVKCGKEIPIAEEECQYCGTRQPEYAKHE